MQLMLLYDLLEPYAVKAARTVLRGEGISNNPDLPDIGKGGNLIDFGTQYHNCTIGDLLEKLAGYSGRPILSFQQPIVAPAPAASLRQLAGEKKDNLASKIVVLETRPLIEKSLLSYLEKRRIPVDIATRFCREVDFLLYNKKYSVIGFPNRSGGFELRNENFKGSSSPKDVSFFNNEKQQLAVFEGFFSYLAFETLNKSQSMPLTNFLILNSLSFFQKCRPIMEDHGKIHLFLDRDHAGKLNTQRALQWDKEKYIDRSSFYQHHKDFNQWLIHHRLSQEQSPKIGRRL